MLWCMIRLQGYTALFLQHSTLDSWGASEAPLRTTELGAIRSSLGGMQVAHTPFFLGTPHMCPRSRCTLFAAVFRGQLFCTCVMFSSPFRSAVDYIV